MALNRPIIGDDEIARIKTEAPPPPGTSWALDPAASSDRMRLFWDDPYVGEIGVAYPSGEWWIGDPWSEDRPSAHGYATDLLSAMRKLTEIAKAIGALDTATAMRELR